MALPSTSGYVLKTIEGCLTSIANQTKRPRISQNRLCEVFEHNQIQLVKRCMTLSAAALPWSTQSGSPTPS